MSSDRFDDAQTNPRSKLDYFALIMSYKIIREYKLLDEKDISEKLKSSFDRWMNDGKHGAEKHIAELVVIEEMMFSFFFGEEINKQVGFEIIPAECHI